MTRRVLIVRLDNDGDVLLAGPAVRAVAAQAEVTLLCGPRGRQAAQLLPGVREVLTFRAPWIDPEPQPVERGAMLAVVDELAARGFDEAVVLTSFHQSALPTALLLRMAGVPVVAAISEDYPGSLLDVRHHVPDGVHEVERGLSLVSTLGYRLPDGDDGRLAVRRRAASAPLPFAAPYVVVHPTASVPARAWPVERNAELVALLAAEGWNVAVTGTAADAGTTAVVAGPPREQVRDLTGATDFAGLADVIAGASVVALAHELPDVQLASFAHLRRARVALMCVVCPDDDFWRR